MMGTWRYQIPSAPGESVDECFWSVHLIKPGVIGDKLSSTWMSGIGITSLTQPGSSVYGSRQSWWIESNRDMFA